MEYLLRRLDRVGTMMKGRDLLLCLDFDGTLSDIASQPRAAFINGRIRRILSELAARTDRCRIAVISGRSLASVREKTGVPGIIYSGNHGLEIAGPGIRFGLRLPRGYLRTVGLIRRRLERGCRDIPGVLVEDKGATVSLHFRKVGACDLPKVMAVFLAAVAAPLAARRIRVRAGKMVLEIVPPVEWNKGRCVLWLRSHVRFPIAHRRILPVYIGDDLTDEDAFRAFTGTGITVRVGKNRDSCAGYYVHTIKEVGAFLVFLASSFREDTV